MTEAMTSEGRQTLRYLGSFILGGLAGAVAISVAVFNDLGWECTHRNRGCNDGQGGIVLVVLVPVMFVVGGLLGCFWRWFRSRLPESSSWVQNNSGARAFPNLVIRLTLPVLLWCLICFGLFRLLIFLNQF
jgi:hypothetical protein